jgi:hypothetical protein
MPQPMVRSALRAVTIALVVWRSLAAEPRCISGIYPSLATFNNEGECGTGAVVPWADRLWVISYGPHLPFGSSDKLYEITPDLKQVIRPESVGGTPANRMIHRESQQLVIGPYLIDSQRKVRVIAPQLMPGRLTGNARHLTDPWHKVYFATMEEGLYEVDVDTLAVTGLIRDGNKPKPGFSKEVHPATIASILPGYHGKGLYSGQERVIYANNGEDEDKRARVDPATPSGALAEWRHPGEEWALVRRNQFTDVTGPGGILGSEHPATDPVWSIGWDHRSLILMCLDHGKWHPYRLPKASHAYDGAHGWNTEWPRIREIGEDALLMTMHGMFWKFPSSFSATNSAGIAPRSSYLKVVGDFCRWNDRVVLGCDDTAKSEFLNKDKLKGDLAAPGQSQSNLWFVRPSQLDDCGPALGRGALWLNDDVKAGAVSEPYLFSGFDHRMVHLAHDGDRDAAFKFEVDRGGTGVWEQFFEVTLAPHSGTSIEFKPEEKGAWVRIRSDQALTKATAFFHFRNREARGTRPDAIFDGIARGKETAQSRGVMLARGAGLKTLRFIATNSSGGEAGYDLDGDLNLKRVDDDPKGLAWTKAHAAIPVNVIGEDVASVIYTDEREQRWRLPRSGGATEGRVCREVCTERNLLNAGGTFYELPAQNAGGFIKVRPIATHGLAIHDYASYRGLMLISGVDDAAVAGGHIVRSDDGKVALWAGAVDDLWKLGKPRGTGGPWLDSAVKANTPSDPFLMTGFDRKRLTLSHKGDGLVRFRLEADFTGTGTWSAVESLRVKPNELTEHRFGDAFSAYWVRLVTDQDTTATAIFTYE